MENSEQPNGEPILRTLAMPADTNPHGDIFGGWIMSQMDIAGGIMARELSASRVVTVAVESIEFLKPVHVGDVVCCYGKVVKVGNTSVTISLEIWVQQVKPRQRDKDTMRKVTQAAFTYVALDSSGEKQPVLRNF